MADESSNFKGAIAGVLNITERVRAEKLFHDMFTTSAIGMYIVQNSKFKLINPQFSENLGYTEDELLNKNYQDIVFPEDRSKVKEKATAMLKGRSTSPYEYRYITGNGETRWVSESVASIEYHGKKATLGTSMDITELKELEQELLTSSKLASVGELAAGIAHEINNPLTGVMGFAQLLVEKKDTPREISKDLESIYQESKRAVRIVQNLLRFARQYKPEKKYVDINELIESTLELQSYELKINNIKVEKNFGTGIPLIIGDYNQLQQVILNIVVNAQQAITETKLRGRIIITTFAENGHVKISIADSGPGITSETMSKIFDPFFTTKQVGKGSGLGLSVCHGFVTEHGGKLYAESIPGKGATFFIELPIMLKNTGVVKEKEAAQTEKGKITSKHTGKILVVDDEPAICDILEKILSEEGHEVDTARSGRIAVNKLAAKKYDICIIDLKMPGMGGSELFSIIQQTYPELSDKVLFITGDTVTVDTHDILQSTGRPYLTKPFDYNKFMELINSILGE
jgi:PAS domain S-box-containing protein